MSFQTGLSGLNASSKSLDVIGNNIANANTVGMKSSVVEFTDLVAASLGPGGGSNVGLGVAVAAVSQQFTQGNITITGGGMDVAINGGGFFQLQAPDGSIAFTRNGQFKLDKDGNIVTNNNSKVMGYPTDLLGNTTSITPQVMTIPTGTAIPANATTSIAATFNLDAQTKPATDTLPATPIDTYGIPVVAYDSQGSEVPVNLYFVKTGPNPALPTPITVDTWEVYDATTVATGRAALAANAVVGSVNAANYALDIANTAYNTANPTATPKPTIANGGIPPFTALPSAPGSLFQMQFDVNGKIVSPTTPPTITLTSPSTSIGSFTATLDVSKATQFHRPFSIGNLTQDGYTAGDLTGVAIESSGIIRARFSNGQTQAQGKLAMADFRNVQGLQQIGGAWQETFASGQPVLGSPGVGKFGVLRAGAVEDSNVDLTAELVNMMTAQRNYQANAQTIKTQDQIMSTLVNLR